MEAEREPERRLFQERDFRITAHGASVDFEKDGVEVNVLLLEKGRGVVYTAGFREEPRWGEDVLRGPARELAGLRCRTISPQGMLEEKEKTPGWLGRPMRQKDVAAIEQLRTIIVRGAPKRTRPLGDFGERVAAAHLCATGQTYGDPAGVGEPSLNVCRPSGGGLCAACSMRAWKRRGGHKQ